MSDSPIFNVEGSPLSQADIERLRSENDMRSVNAFILTTRIFMAACVFFAVIGKLIFDLPLAEHALWLLVPAWLIHTFLCDAAEEKYQNTKALVVADADTTIALAKLFSKDLPAEVESYRLAVASMGRKYCIGEYKALYEYIREKQENDKRLAKLSEAEKTIYGPQEESLSSPGRAQ